jgi:hypothetical protein
MQTSSVGWKFSESGRTNGLVWADFWSFGMDDVSWIDELRAWVRLRVWNWMANVETLAIPSRMWQLDITDASLESPIHATGTDLRVLFGIGSITRTTEAVPSVPGQVPHRLEIHGCGGDRNKTTIPPTVCQHWLFAHIAIPQLG